MRGFSEWVYDNWLEAILGCIVGEIFAAITLYVTIF